ncbi:hypothetical protein, partial [Streptomyces mirabilis]|uniref:hypothetical protein n=1 Tax=Streptomyces mirabilis TaxID=68239 RepID=UPI00340FD7D6
MPEGNTRDIGSASDLPPRREESLGSDTDRDRHLNPEPMSGDRDWRLNPEPLVHVPDRETARAALFSLRSQAIDRVGPAPAYNQPREEARANLNSTVANALRRREE